jgi:hypothetical protein
MHVLLHLDLPVHRKRPVYPSHTLPKIYVGRLFRGLAVVSGYYVVWVKCLLNSMSSGQYAGCHASYAPCMSIGSCTSTVRMESPRRGIGCSPTREKPSLVSALCLPVGEFRPWQEWSLLIQ